MGELYGSVINATAKTLAEINEVFTASQSYTIPAGYTQADVFAVGGGGSSYNKSDSASGFSVGGGGGGYAVNNYNVAISPGATLNIIVGAGGESGGNGGTSYISNIGTTADGGKGCIRTTSSSGKFYAGNGGSGGGGGGNSSNAGANGGTDGANGGSNGGSYIGGTGQGTTTRAWGMVRLTAEEVEGVDGPPKT